MEKLWGGRFQETAEAWVEQFGASIHFDAVLAPYDLEGSLAHVKMLKKQAILSEQDADQIIDGLHSLQKKLAEGSLTFKVSAEDIHLNMEQLLTAEIGPVAGKLHTARSRNDQIATDMHLYLKDQVQLILADLKDCRSMFVQQAEKNIETILPGLTHLQHAQPISLGHHFLAYYEMLTRDAARLKDALKRIDLSPLGAAALAGTTFPLDREFSASCLGLSDLYTNSLDAVSDRDFILEFMSAASILMMHLSRFCEELILWSSHEYQYIELADSFSTGSSIMPQKKNPDMAELIRGKSGRVYGHLFSLLTVMKGLPLTYNKDLQEDKEGMFDTVETLKGCLPILTGMLASLTIHPEKMFEATTKDFSNATELADYLATLDIPFRQAHEIVGKLVLHCTQQGNYLQDLPLTEYQAIHPAITAEIYTILASKTAVNRRNTFGGTGFTQVKNAVQQAQLQLKNE